MTDSSHALSRYERRLALVVDVILAQTSLGKAEAESLAVATLHAVDHIKEIVR